jgi:hypothetical protein
MFVEADIVKASPTVDSSLFGSMVALDGDRLAVGAPGEDSFEGAVYMFHWDGASWVQVARLVSNAPAAQDSFGTRLALDGDRLMVGAPGDSGNLGSVEFFEWSGAAWVYQSTLVAGDQLANDRFGNSLALQGDRVVIGAPMSSAFPATLRNGKVYVFDWSGAAWVETQRIQPGEVAGTDDRFGAQVALDGDRLAVASFDDGPGDAFSSNGAVYVYDLSGTWTLTEKVVQSDPGVFHFFGAQIDLEGDELVVGCQLDSAPGGGATGSAYYFVWNTTNWVETQKFFPVAQDAQNFGIALDRDGTRLLVGAHVSDDVEVNQGATWYWELEGGVWVQKQKIVASDPGPSDIFGIWVAVSGSRSATGAQNHEDPPDTDTGAVYIHDYTC